MMARYFLHIAYSGENYCGWQRQQNAVSVQQVLEETLQTLLRFPVSIVGCGRTDTGVNASSYFAHLDIGVEDFEGFGEKFAYQLNSILPKDIVVYDVYEVAGEMHARFSAISRTYKYYIHNEKNPFIDRFSYFIPFAPNIEAINEAGQWLLTQNDFTSFAKLHTDNKTNLCTLTEAKIEGMGDNRFVFTFIANRFLRNMVRAMVGTLLEVGSGKISQQQFRDIVMAQDRCSAGVSVPAKALFLTDIKYGN